MNEREPLIVDLRVKLPEKDDDILEYLSNEMNISKSVIVRLALRDFFITAEEQLSGVELLYKRAKEGSNSGTQRRLLSKLNNMQASFDELRCEVNDI